jgi:hypothetical protein
LVHLHAAGVRMPDEQMCLYQGADTRLAVQRPR